MAPGLFQRRHLFLALEQQSDLERKRCLIVFLHWAPACVKGVPECSCVYTKQVFFCSAISLLNTCPGQCQKMGRSK